MGLLQFTCIVMALVVFTGTTRSSQVSANSGSPCGTCANNHCCVKQGTQYTCKRYRMVGYSCTYDLNGAMAVSGTYYPGKTDCPCWTGLTCLSGTYVIESSCLA
ncbi:hypothetical protein BaRGS_00026343 [Batillaria attramentaria]|uniref:Uncharacterized protein n=1 Tax=Batillaria attramentaria TaxID=370345 RepID=A0ABD0K507_9CAEN